MSVVNSEMYDRCRSCLRVRAVVVGMTRVRGLWSVNTVKVLALHHVSEVVDCFLDGKKFFVESGVFLLGLRQLSGKKAQRSSIFLR